MRVLKDDFVKYREFVNSIFNHHRELITDLQYQIQLLTKIVDRRQEEKHDD